MGNRRDAYESVVYRCDESSILGRLIRNHKREVLIGNSDALDHCFYES